MSAGSSRHDLSPFFEGISNRLLHYHGVPVVQAVCDGTDNHRWEFISLPKSVTLWFTSPVSSKVKRASSSKGRKYFPFDHDLFPSYQV
jgi:hypothetical protein